MRCPYHRFLVARAAADRPWKETQTFLDGIGFPEPPDDAEEWAANAAATRPELFAPEIGDRDAVVWLRMWGIEEAWTDTSLYAKILSIPFRSCRLAVESLLLAGMDPNVISAYVQRAFPGEGLAHEVIELYSRMLFDRAALGPSGWMEFLKRYEPEAFGDLWMFYSSGPEYALSKMGIDAEIDPAKLVRAAIKDTRAMMVTAQGNGDIFNGVKAAQALFSGIKLYAEVKESDLETALKDLRIKREPPRILEGAVVDGVVVPATMLPQQEVAE